MRLFVLIMSVAAASLCVPALALEPAKSIQQLTAEQWHEDLLFMAAELKSRHANLYHLISAEQFDAAVADLDRRIPQLQRNQIVVGMMRIAAMVGDGHTRVDPRKDKAFGFRSLPLKLYWFEDGIVVRAAKPEYRGLLGARVEAVGGVPIAEAIRRTSEIISQDTVSGARQLVPFYLAMPDILQALGLSSFTDAASLTLVSGGKRWTARVPVAEVAELWPPDTDIALITPEGWADTRTAPLPLWLQAPLDYHRLVPLPEQKALYAQLNMVTDTDKETLGGFGRRILDQARMLNPRTVVLDLRLNQGGNGDLRNGLIADLIRTQDADTRLFVLAGRGTFSASEFILEDLDRLTDAVFIGEPASSRPISYGDAYQAKLPNSGIAVRSSIRYWRSGQDERPYIPIDVATPFKFADYVAGRDPALEAALSYRSGADLLDLLGQAARAGGPDAATMAAKAYVDDPAHRYRDVQFELIMAEQNLLGKKQGAAALAVSRWSSARFSRNPDLATVLAYVANQQGAKDEARKAISAALAIDPKSRSAQNVQEIIERK
jgi:hypothetical protein